MSDATEPPEPPGEIPQYVADGVRRQDKETLRLIQEYAQNLINWLETPVDVEEAVDEDEELVDVQETSRGGALVEKEIPCGKNCGGCPHGPYLYRVYREGDKVKTEYLGPGKLL